MTTKFPPESHRIEHKRKLIDALEKSPMRLSLPRSDP